MKITEKFHWLKLIRIMPTMLLIVAFTLSCSSEVEILGGSSSSMDGDAPSSSSMEEQDGDESSSSTPSIPEPLACDTVPASEYATLPITPPDLTCSNGEKATNIRWLGVPPNWNNPKDGTYSDISVIANCGTTANLMASCPGILTVYPMVSCSVGSIGYEGIAIKPVLACSDGSEPFDTVFSGYLPEDWDNPAVRNYAVFAEANCGHGTLPKVFCGTLIVNPITLTCGSVPASGYEGIEISQPALVCNHGTRGTTTWTNAPNWSNPARGIYSNISVTATCGSVTREANCGDSLNVSCSGNSNTSTHYCSDGTMREYGSVSHGGQTYKTVVIGAQTWMAENLNYNPELGNSACYDNQASYCATHGRLYDWNTAITVCPSGWHLPSQTEWNTLSEYVQSNSNCSNCDGAKLKATSGWVSYNNIDEYGFSALGGGYGFPGGSGFGNVGRDGYWWTATDNTCEQETCAYVRFMHQSDDRTSVHSHFKSFLFSVRCLLDSPGRPPS